MKRASYRAAIEWVALNDSGAEDLTEEQCGELITSVLVADLFAVDDSKVGRDVYRERAKHKKREQ
jgi:hypothetical protein